jgi:transcription initiation factor TFIIH subunit 2
LRRSLDTAGDASLQNGLDLAVSSLASIPPYGHREVLVLLAALSTCDPGDIADSARGAAAAKVRVSVVGLAAEVHVCRTLAQATGGVYSVATGEAHLEELLLAHATPPAAAPGASGASLVRMGFPAKASQAPGTSAFVGADCALAPGAFACPRCAARTAELPAECHVCGLTLVSSPHLARSYHHLFPVPPFAEVPAARLPEAQVGRAACVRRAKPSRACSSAVAEAGRRRFSFDVQGGGGSGGGGDLVVPELEGRAHCYGCMVSLEPGPKATARGGAPAPAAAAEVVLQCPGCRRLFCFDCDSYIHEQLHNCPGCECLGGKDAGIADVEMH